MILANLSIGKKSSCEFKRAAAKAWKWSVWENALLYLLAHFERLLPIQHSTSNIFPCNVLYVRCTWSKAFCNFSLTLSSTKKENECASDSGRWQLMTIVIDGRWTNGAVHDFTLSPPSSKAIMQRTNFCKRTIGQTILATLVKLFCCLFISTAGALVVITV